MLYGDNKLYGDNFLYKKISTKKDLFDKTNVKINPQISKDLIIYHSVSDSVNLTTDSQTIHYDNVIAKVDKELINPLDWKNYIDKIPNWKEAD